MKISTMMKAVVLSLVLGTPAFANSDSSAVDANAMATVVKSSKGVMIRVPVNEQGQELAAGSEMRVVNDAATSSDTAKSVWDNGLDASKGPRVDSSTSADSSTHGWRRWGWNNWVGYNWGWYAPYYYTTYYPTYYYGDYVYNYGVPTYYNYYAPGYYYSYPAWGYRYYYYPRGW